MKFRTMVFLSTVGVTFSLTTIASGQIYYLNPGYPLYPAYSAPMANADGVVVVGSEGAGLISMTNYFGWYGGFYQRVYPGAQPPAGWSSPKPPPAVQVGTQSLPPAEEIREAATVTPLQEAGVVTKVATTSPAPVPATRVTAQSAAPEVATTSRAPAHDGTATSEGEEWSFRLAPYLWIPAVDVTVGAGSAPSDPDATADADSGIFGLDFGLLLMGEVRRGQFGIVGDFAYVAASPDGISPGPSFSDVEFQVHAAVGTFGAFYSFPEWYGVIADTIIGFRFWNVGLDLDFSAGELGPVSVDLDGTWVDPIIGVRLGADLGNGFYVIAYGDIGGFGLGSDISWQAYGGLGYWFEDWISAELGYRYIFVDRDIESVPFELGLHAPLIAVNFIF